MRGAATSVSGHSRNKRARARRLGSSRRRRGRDADIPRRWARRGDAAAGTRIFRGDAATDGRKDGSAPQALGETVVALGETECKTAYDVQGAPRLHNVRMILGPDRRSCASVREPLQRVELGDALVVVGGADEFLYSQGVQEKLITAHGVTVQRAGRAGASVGRGAAAGRRLVLPEKTRRRRRLTRRNARRRPGGADHATPPPLALAKTRGR